VLGAAECEHLVHYRNPGNIFIKVDPVKGSNNVACGARFPPLSRRTRKRFVRLLATVEKWLVARMAQSSQAKSTTFKPDLES